VGRAGQLLTSMLKAVGFRREDVYIANVLKCRPPGNRDPRPEEARACRGYLERQIELVSPTLIVAVGRIAAQNLLATDTPLGKLRARSTRSACGAGRWSLTYHPAYLLRSPGEKRKAWQDLLFARQVFGRLESGEQVLFVSAAGAELHGHKRRLVKFRAMAPSDVPSVSTVERASYTFPWSEGHLPRLPARRIPVPCRGNRGRDRRLWHRRDGGPGRRTS